MKLLSRLAAVVFAEKARIESFSPLELSIGRLRGLWAVVLVLAAGASRAGDTSPPFVAITSPIAGSSFAGKTILRATATGDSGTARVHFLVDGVQVTPELTGEVFTYPLDTLNLSPGQHSLVAIVEDGEGNKTRSMPVAFITTNAAIALLSAESKVFEDLGSLVSVNTQEKQVMFRNTVTGDLHLLLYYVVKDVKSHPFQILDVNLTRETVRIVDAVLGRPGPYATVLHPNGRVYIASSDPGYLMEYDPLSGSARQISKLHPALRRDAQTACIDSNGRVFIAEYNPTGGGSLGSYDPAQDRFEDLGIVDPTHPGPQYSYSIAADGRWVYIGLGQVPWYLAIYDTVSRTATVLFKSEGDKDGGVFIGKNGGLFYKRGTPTGNKYYSLANGAASPIAALPETIGWWQEHDRVVLEPGLFPSRFGIEVNLDSAYPDNARNYATVRWRSTSEAAWKSATASGFRLQPAVIKRLAPGSDGMLWGFADFYGPVFRYDPQARVINVLGRPQFSLYDLLPNRDQIILSGYPAATLDCRPSRDWSLAATTPDKSSLGVNPRKLPIQVGKYHFYSAFGADGTLFVGGHHERDSVGGELGWYDPVTGATGSHRAPFLEDDVRDLKPVLGATKMVYASNNEKLFVVDVATRSIERVIRPIAGVGPLEKIVEVSPGIVLGVASNRVFRVNILTGETLAQSTLFGAPFGGSSVLPYDRRLSLGPDGYVWMFLGSNLCRVDPRSMAVETVAVTPPGGIVFQGLDLYVHSGAALRRIRGAFRSLQPMAPLNLQIGGGSASASAH